MPYDVKEIAKKIIARTDVEHDDLISNLKLQKLLYYMQGFHLACFDSPLFDDEIEAWQYGPVVPCVYEQYKHHKGEALPMPTGSIIALTDEEESIFEQVYQEYAQFSAVKLMNMTHEEAPWKTTETGFGNIISKEKIRTFFLTLVEE